MRIDEFQAVLEDVCSIEQQGFVPALIDASKRQLKGIICIDHATFVTPFAEKDRFLEYWSHRGLAPLPALMTSQYPAEHIALVPDASNIQACGQMVGLSVSTDPASPINELLRRHPHLRHPKYPGSLQHIAFAVSPEQPMESVVAQLESEGVRLMTPVLRTMTRTRTTIVQAFTGSAHPYGAFCELIQREAPGSSMSADGAGTEEKLFATSQIDRLYEGYDAYSRNLLV